MAIRIVGVDLPQNKRGEVGLTYIYGIGRNSAKKILETAYDRELTLYGSAPYNLDLLYYIGMIAVKEGRKFDAILAYMDIKGIYVSGVEENKKKADLYKAIKNLDE